MRALDPEVLDTVWAAIEPLVPLVVEVHPLGCHRPRAADRDCFEVMLVRLSTGCSWEDAERLCANKVSGIRAALIHDHFSAEQGVEDDDMNIICIGGRTVGPSVAWELVETFLAARFSHAPRHERRLSKVARLELEATRSHR